VTTGSSSQGSSPPAVAQSVSQQWSPPQQLVSLQVSAHIRGMSRGQRFRPPRFLQQLQPSTLPLQKEPSWHSSFDRSSVGVSQGHLSLLGGSVRRNVGLGTGAGVGDGVGRFVGDGVGSCVGRLVGD